MIRYTIGAVAIYVVTFLYFLRSGDKEFNTYIASIFVTMCFLFSLPLLKVLLRFFFEYVEVTQKDVTRHFFITTTVDWADIQYFTQRPNTAIITNMIVQYEMGDFRKKIAFDSTISNREQLLRYIRDHVKREKTMQRGRK